jgi:hypothetical protein
MTAVATDLYLTKSVAGIIKTAELLATHDQDSSVAARRDSPADQMGNSTNLVTGTQADHETADLMCTSYFRGLTDALYMSQVFASKGARTCMPDSSPISVSDARDAFEKWLRAHPNALQNSAGLVASWAVLDQYKCP